MPEVSIIVTTYNRPLLLRETLKGILDQTFQDFELIVVDNFSNYDFLNLINEFNDERIRLFQNENNGIIAVNRNFGIKKAKGKYLAFCDDDDIWLPNKLEIQLQSLRELKADLIYSNTRLFFEEGKEKDTNYRCINNMSALLWGNDITLSTVLVKKTKDVFFNEDKNFLALEDYELWIRLMKKKFKFKFIYNPLIRYRVIDTSISRKSKAKNEKVNLKFRYFLLGKYNLTFYERVIIFLSLVRRMTRYIAFLILKM